MCVCVRARARVFKGTCTEASCYLVELHCGDDPFKVKKKILKKARSLDLSAPVVSSEAKNDILQFAGKEFASEPLISS